MKKSREIDTAKPAAPGQSNPLRRWDTSSHTVTGSQTKTASGKNG
jgi:hypothetical protein